MEKVQFKIGGMSCSSCTETIRRSVGRIEGVHEVHVSLAHEETLILYDPTKVVPQEFKKAIMDVGYTVQDPDKVRTFEEQEEEIRQPLPEKMSCFQDNGLAQSISLARRKRYHF